MPMSTEPSENAAAAIEAEVDEIIAVCGGDARDAVRAMLIANAHMELEIERLANAVSAGFARGRVRRRKDPAEAAEKGEDKKVG